MKNRPTKYLLLVTSTIRHRPKNRSSGNGFTVSPFL